MQQSEEWSGAAEDYINFKKAAFGGFDRDDVIAYIENLKRQLAQSEQKAAEKEAAEQAVIQRYSQLSTNFKESLESVEKKMREEYGNIIKERGQSSEKIQELENENASLRQQIAVMAENNLKAESQAHLEKAMNEKHTAYIAALEKNLTTTSAGLRNTIITLLEQQEPRLI